MIRFAVQRVLQALAVLFLVSLIAFLMTNVLPGDPVLALLGPEGASEEFIAAKRTELGLDKPLAAQYALWLGGVLKGNLGRSALTGQSAIDVVISRVPVSLQLMFLAVTIAILIAIPWAVYSSRHQGTWMDNIGSILALTGVAVPSFWLGMLLILVFSVWLHILPSSGYVSPSKGVLTSLAHMLLPGFALGAALAAEIMRQLRSALIEVYGELYISAARAKGLPDRIVVFKHAMRNAVTPVVTLLGLRIGALIGGAVVVEVVFSVPGVGQAAMDAILTRDYAIVQALVLMAAASIVFITTIIDIGYGWLDPRLRR